MGFANRSGRGDQFGLGRLLGWFFGLEIFVLPSHNLSVDRFVLRFAPLAVFSSFLRCQFSSSNHDFSFRYLFVA